MILFRKISLKLLSEQGRAFKWEPCECEKCKRLMWGHGFVTRYLAEILSSVFMKRFRCDGCGVVVTTRPDDYYRYTRSSIDSIYHALTVRLSAGSWPAGTSRQRAGHWLKKLGLKARMDFGDNCNLTAILNLCFEKNISFFT